MVNDRREGSLGRVQFVGWRDVRRGLVGTTTGAGHSGWTHDQSEVPARQLRRARGYGFRPDVAGWRRERVPEPPLTRPALVRPDWICEVLSASNRHNDTIRKLRHYHAAGVPHYWLLDPDTGTLNVFRHEAQGYLNVLIADRAQRVRAEPFQVVEVLVGALLGDDPE